MCVATHVPISSTFNHIPYKLQCYFKSFFLSLESRLKMLVNTDPDCLLVSLMRECQKAVFVVVVVFWQPTSVCMLWIKFWISLRYFSCGMVPSLQLGRCWSLIMFNDNSCLCHFFLPIHVKYILISDAHCIGSFVQQVIK